MEDDQYYIKAENLEIRVPNCAVQQMQSKDGQGIFTGIDLRTLVVASAVSVLVGIVIKKLMD